MLAFLHVLQDFDVLEVNDLLAAGDITLKDPRQFATSFAARARQLLLCYGSLPGH